MSWADIKNKYKSGGTAATQSTEDIAARRILRALGLTEKGLFAAEKAAGLDLARQADTTLLERVEALARHIAGRKVHSLPPVRDVRNPKEAEDTVLELAEANKAPRLVYRVKGTDGLVGLLRLGDALVDLDTLPMPCRLAKSKDESCVLLTCDAQVLYNTLLKPEVPYD